MSDKIKVLEHRFLQNNINPTGLSSRSSGKDIILSLVTWKEQKTPRYQLRLLTHTRGYDMCDDVCEEFFEEFAPCYERGVWNPEYCAILGQIPREKWHKLYEGIMAKPDFEVINNFFK